MAEIVSTNAKVKLSQRLQKDHGLDVSHRAAQLNHAHVGGARLAVDGNLGDALNPRLRIGGSARQDIPRHYQ